MIDKEKYITTSELAKMLGISRVAVFKKIKSGELKATEYGKSYIIEKDALPVEIKEKIKLQQEKAISQVEKAQKSGTDLSFEKELWEAADRLRGNIDASEYKHIVLGLLFLKYISDSYYQRRLSLEEWTSNPKNTEYYADNKNDRSSIVNDKDQYVGAGVFYVPKKSRWEFLCEKLSRPDLGKYIDEAMDAIENENQKQLKGVLPKIYTKTTLESEELGELVKIFSRIKFDHNIDNEKDILGRVYEYFLGQFATAEGKRGGEFYTPRSIVRLLVEILAPYENARVLDPSCGSGGMFVQSSEFLKIHEKDPSKIAFYGQESNQTTIRLCKMNLAIRGIIGNIEYGNSYYSDKFPDLRADFCIANPPFNADWDPGRISDSDPRIKYGTAPKTNANFMWIQHFIHHLAPNGMAGFVMANGALAVGGQEGDIRRRIIKEDLVDVIVACPPKLFYNVALPVSLWFISKNKKNGRFRNRTGEVLFIDARDKFIPVPGSRKQVTFTNNHIIEITKIVHNWRGEENAETYEDVPGFCKSIELAEIERKNYVLTPGLYVGAKEEYDDGIPYNTKITNLKKEIEHYFNDNDKLKKEIIKIINKAI